MNFVSSSELIHAANKKMLGKLSPVLTSTTSSNNVNVTCYTTPTQY